MKEYFYANLFIEQMRKFLKVGEKQLDVFYDFPRVIINPVVFEPMDHPQSIMIHDVELLDKTLKKYWDIVQNTDILFTRINESHQLKYYLTNIWRNATNDDYEHPVEFFNRMISFIKDATFEDLDNGKLLGSFLNDDILVKRKQAKRCFETPYELSFVVRSTGKNGVTQNAELPVLRYGITQDGIKSKKAWLYAIQNEGDRISSDLELKWKDINSTISGMKNRGVHARPFLLSLAVSLGLFRAIGVKEILINDLQFSRFYTLNKKLEKSDCVDSIQNTITNKFLKTMLRMEYEFSNLSVTSYPNDIDNYMHMRLEDELVSNNPLLQEAYQLGRNAYEKNAKSFVLKK